MSPEQIIKYAEECELPVYTHKYRIADFAQLIEQHVRADAREQCAKACDDARLQIAEPPIIEQATYDAALNVCLKLADRIRARKP